MEEAPTAVVVNNLVKQYSKKDGALKALNDISFEVPLGRVCCLLGPNGSGKTTLLKVLTGLLAPTSGSFAIMGVDPTKDARGVRSSLGWMPAEERSGFYGRLTGRENLKFFGALYGLSPKEMDRSIGNLCLLLGLNDEIDKMILKVSAGTKQKIGLARALLHNPAVLFLDEPLRNLDPHTVVRFRRLLKDHLTRQQKKTILLSTHQLDEAKRIADLILIIKDGKMVRSVEARDLEKELRNSTLEEFYIKTIDAQESQ